MEKGKGFIIYGDYKDSFGLLSGEQCKELLMALFELFETGKTKDFSDGMVKMAFLHMSGQLMRDKEKYDEVCKKRSEYARKGGLAKAAKRCQKEAKAANTNTDTDTDTNTDADVNTNTDTNTDADVNANTETKEASPELSTQKNEKEVPEHYGQYGHVQLTDEQHKSLEAEYGRDLTAEYIRKIDEWSQLTGKKYLDYYLAVVNWIKKDSRDKPSSGCSDDDFDVEKYKQFINCF